MKEQLDESIEKFKQVLDTLPTNNIKNRQNKIKIINDELTNIKEKRNEVEVVLSGGQLSYLKEQLARGETK